MQPLCLLVDVAFVVVVFVVAMFVVCCFENMAGRTSTAGTFAQSSAVVRVVIRSLVQ